MARLTPDNARFNANADSVGDRWNALAAAGGGGYGRSDALDLFNRGLARDRNLLRMENEAALAREAIRTNAQTYSTDVGAATARRNQDLQDNQFRSTLGFNERSAAEGRALDRYQSDLSARVATQGQQTSLQAALAGTDAQRYGADQSLRADMYRSDRTLDAARVPYEYKRGLVDQFGGQFSSALSALANNSFSPAAVPSVERPTAPALNATGAGSAYAARAQVDRAKNESTGQARKEATANSLAGRGFGANSPLALALASGIDTGTQVANTEADALARVEAAKINADQQLGGAQIAAQQYADYQTALANAQKVGLGYYNQQSANAANILAQLSGLFG